MSMTEVLMASAAMIVLGGCEGDTTMSPLGSPSIQITDTASDRIAGTATVPDPEYRVVLWAKTDRWYVQPLIASPYTVIGADGGWSSNTHPWTRMVALLVNPAEYDPGSTRSSHPAADPGVVAWDEKPERSADRYFNWSGHRWRVKTGDLAGPGPNYFSDAEENVTVDDGGVRLRITQRDGKWYCGEIVLVESLGFGTYEFQIGTPVTGFDVQTVASGFIYENAGREIDIEFAGDQLIPGVANAQYVVQPHTEVGNLHRFALPETLAQTTHRFIWAQDRIRFESWQGHAPDPTESTLLRAWIYEGGSVPPPGGERMRFNLWLFQGDAPVNNTGDEFLIESFHFASPDN